MPAPSWPRIEGKIPSLSRPSRGEASVWQIPVAFISTRTSPAFGPSRSSSTISSGFLASKATAARVFIREFPSHSQDRKTFTPRDACSFFSHAGIFRLGVGVGFVFVLGRAHAPDLVIDTSTRKNENPAHLADHVRANAKSR